MCRFELLIAKNEFRISRALREEALKLLENERENHKMMLDHYRNNKNMLISYDKKAMGFF